MAAKRAPAQAATQQFEIGSIFEQELQALNEDLRRQAAVAMFQKLSPTNRTTVEQFLQQLRSHKDVWATVSAMGIVDFADCINDGRRLRDQARQRTADVADGDARRTRLNDRQKQQLKSLVLRVLSEAKEGLNRNQIAKALPDEQIAAIGVDPSEAALKLRQPLGELVTEGKIYTQGEKRLLKYLYGSGAPGKKKG